MRSQFAWYSACFVFLLIAMYTAFLSWMDWDWEAVAMMRAMMDAEGVIPVLSWMVELPPGGWWLTWYPLVTVVSFGSFLGCLHRAKPRLRWLQFRLRSLLLLVTAAGVLLAAWLVVTEPYRQWQTAEMVTKLGGRIVSIGAPAWIPRFGHDLRKIVFVDVADLDDPEEYLKALAVLPAFETLAVGGPQFGDEQLRRLHGLRTLRGLVLDCTEVTDAGLAEVQQALPALEVYRSPRRAVRAIETAIENVWGGNKISLIVKKPSIQPLPQLAAVVGSKYFEDLTTCQLYSDAQILYLKHLPDLPKLRLIGEDVTDAGMVQVGKLASLTALSLEFDTQVTDAGLAHLKGLTNLADLYIMDGHITVGPIFDAKITDAGLAHLADLPNLRSLNFHGAGITDAGLAQLTNLESLELESSYITDDGLAHLSGLKNLRSLNLSSTDIRGTGLVHLQSLPRLAELNLGGTNISDAELRQLKKFRNLKVLRLDNVDASERAVTDLRKALSGCEVSHSPTADGPVMRAIISIERAAVRSAQAPERPRDPQEKSAE